MQNKLSRRVIARTIAEKLLSEPSRRSHWLRVLAAYMIDQKMVDDLDLMIQDIIREIFAQSGELLVTATTARPLTETLRQDVTKILRQATGAKQILLHEEVDANLLGGFVARTPDAEMDASVRTSLQQLAVIK